jgi:hypothetical protein
MLEKDEVRLGYAIGTDEGPIDFRTAQQKHFKEVYNLNDKEIASLDKPNSELYMQTKKKMEKFSDIDAIEMMLEEYKKAKKEERAEMKEGGPGIEALRQVAPEVVERMGYEEGGSIDDQMMMVMTPPMESEMEPDGEMEDGYTRFIMEEALSEDEEDMLMSKLEQDEELAMLFDKVIDVAQEFAGAGPVEGPGSGVSDSIPARLSDGEFVFTAKAVEEIGADNLMAMMKDAEAKADERQPLQEGGIPELREETRPVETPQMTEQVIRVEKGPQTEQVGVSGSLLDSREEENPLYEEMAFKRPPVHGAGYGR